MRVVCIAGFAELSRRWANEQPPEVEIWGMNEVHLFIKRWTLWFQIHPKDFRVATKVNLGMNTKLPLDGYGRPQQHVDWLAKCGVPVFMQEPDPRIPTSVQYPYEEVWKILGGRKYLSSTPAYMLAYALTQPDIEEIRVSGVELAIGTERISQRPNFEWLMGLAEGMGKRVVLPPWGCALLNGPLYGIDPTPVLAKDVVNQPRLVVATARGIARVKMAEEPEPKK